MSTKKPASFSKPVPSKNSENFETLKLTAMPARGSKIIARDVAKTDPKVEKTAKSKSTTKVKTTAKKSTASKSTPAKTTASKTIVARPVKPSAKEIKEKEIEKAIKSAAKLPTVDSRKSAKRFSKFGWTRIILATACAATAIFAVVYFVNLTSTDMSLKVAAMQSGIDAHYPNYIPRGYSLSDVMSASGKVTMNFKSGEDGAFGLSEESSNWDSNALLNNFVRPTYGEDYATIKEQGLTIYIGDKWATWVNGGIVYKLTVTSGSLTKKQMKTIATSL